MAFAVECLHLLSLDSQWLACLRVVCHQSCLLGPEGNERGNPRCLCVPKATLVNERAGQTVVLRADLAAAPRRIMRYFCGSCQLAPAHLFCSY